MVIQNVVLDICNLADAKHELAVELRQKLTSTEEMGGIVRSFGLKATWARFGKSGLIIGFLGCGRETVRRAVGAIGGFSKAYGAVRMTFTSLLLHTRPIEA